MKKGWTARKQHEVAQSMLTAAPGKRFEVTGLAKKSECDVDDLRRYLNREALSLQNGHARGPRLGREFAPCKHGRGQMLVAVTFIAHGDGLLADANVARMARRASKWNERVKVANKALPKVIGRMLMPPDVTKSQFAIVPIPREKLKALKAQFEKHNAA